MVGATRGKQSERPSPTVGEATDTHVGAGSCEPGVVRGFRLAVVDGPAAGATWASAGDRSSIGLNESNDLVVEDSTVSRFHCEIRVERDGARVRDLQSRNGTVVDGVSVVEAFLRSGSLLRLGKTVVQFEYSGQSNRLPLSDRPRFGSLSGVSAAMRSTFAILARAAERDVTVLLEGETGTGKSQAALSIHREGARKAGPFVVVDCGAILANLLESELFGHEKGAFTGATERRIGAFEEASGGTIFLDEVGELPPDLQPKLLRVLEAREIRRVGSNSQRPVDVRVVAATNRDLRTEVNSGRFRADLYFRLAVVKIAMPPLRQRPEDIPALLAEILTSLHATPDEAAALGTPELVQRLRQSAWPGNVRELRNYVEQCVVFCGPPPMSRRDLGATSPPAVDASVPFTEARQRALAAFERGYLEALLELHDGKITRAATAAELDRRYLYRLLNRHGLG